MKAGADLGAILHSLWGEVIECSSAVFDVIEVSVANLLYYG